MNLSLKKLNSILGIFAAVVLLTSASCHKKEKKNGPEEPASTFDKQAMLVNYADNLILPCYANFKISLDSLITVYGSFKTSGSQNDLQLVKQKLNSAYLNYQRISLFGFGPAEDLAVRINFNIFPTDTSQIKANIANGNYDLALANNTDAKGFPALDYLFYGNNISEAQMAATFSASTARKQYADALLSEMSSKISQVIAAWNSAYRTTFVNSLGTDVSSSIGYMVNQINYELDYLKNAKIATPYGLRSGGTPLPGDCEALYGGQSTTYALETLTIIENTYLGKSFAGNNGKGFDDYLDHLGAQYAGGSLNAAITAQFAAAKTKLAAVGNPLSAKVISDPLLVDAAYKELVKLLVLLKTDLPSNLGVVITYQDGDAD
jgi:predicted lipoprotein